MRIKKDLSVNIAIKPQGDLKTISNDKISLEIFTNQIDGEIQMKYQASHRKDSKLINFDIRYYENYFKRFEEDRAGGLYIFKTYTPESLPYN